MSDSTELDDLRRRVEVLEAQIDQLAKSPELLAQMGEALFIPEPKG